MYDGYIVKRKFIEEVNLVRNYCILEVRDVYEIIWDKFLGKECLVYKYGVLIKCLIICLKIIWWLCCHNYVS